jgi:hypothetical protein
MTRPGPFGVEQQRQLVWQIGQVLTAPAPRGWRQVTVRYRAAGRHVEADLLVTGPDGVTRAERPVDEAVRLLGTLRSAMYEPGRGTWLAAELSFRPATEPTARYVLDHEPSWRRVPPPIGFRDELSTFPRAEQNIPPWFRQRLGPAAEPEPAQTAEEMRTPRVYDGLGPDGRPLVRRPQLAPEERDRVLSYLDGAPVVLAARGHDNDAFDPDRPAAVPMNFRTDGNWVWPGAVAYYLRVHAVTPDPDLLSHIRSRRFILPDVDEPTKELAVAAITGQLSTED